MTVYDTQYLFDLISSKMGADITLNGEIRELDVPFLINEAHNALVIYTVELAATAPLAEEEYAQVDLLCDQYETPSTLITSAYLKGQQLLGLVGIGLTTTERQVLIGYVPMGQYVCLATAGTGTKTLIYSFELMFNA